MKQLIVAAAATLILPTMTSAAELKVLSTQATEDTYRELTTISACSKSWV
jgi:hypothetical protein